MSTVHPRDYLPEIYMSALFVGAGLLSNKAQRYPVFARKFLRLIVGTSTIHGRCSVRDY